MCPWTCLSGTSVSPPHPCIQSPVLTGTRRAGMSGILRAKPGPTHPPPGPGLGPCSLSCAATRRRPATLWLAQASSATHTTPAVHVAARPEMGPRKSSCTPGMRATTLTPHPASRQGSWAASDTTMCTRVTASCCPHPVLPRPVTMHGTA